ncbi:MAG: ATP-binding cassette domain-containing protein [Micromonosporaceae bacterium]|nr:ATP-binding cassette domain-containing protein [Micromonosporaceae bacterium]
MTNLFNHASATAEPVEAAHAGAGPPAPSARTFLEVSKLKKVYGTETKTPVEALHEISLDVREREFVCVVGPSGCGKTTLLRCIAGLLPPTSGQIALQGHPIDMTPEGMAVVFQDYSRSLFPWMSVSRNVTLPLSANGVARRERRMLAAQALEAVGLTGAADRYPWQLSGGMQQRVAIARALAFQPKILLMDEPFASVDAQTRADLEDVVLRVHGEFSTTVLFVTHDVDEAVYLSDRVIVLSSAPTRIREVVPVELARPRDQAETRELREFVELRTRVYRGVRGR